MPFAQQNVLTKYLFFDGNLHFKYYELGDLER